MAARISVVTSSFNQGRFIGRTIESVLAQQYPDVEHIVVDGMSTDNTCEVLAQYPHLRIIREPDSGQAEAINKGFRVATGDIFCFLNSDDTFLPGALARIAQEIDPARGRHIVMGRCRYVDEEDRFLGIEHPSAFEGHRRVLEVWKAHCIPQPATFWTRAVWERCGPLDEREQHVLDYDLFCRFSKHYEFHWIDQALATYRLQAQSKTCTATEAQTTARAIAVSRRYWGPLWRWQYWRLAWSCAWYAYNWRGKAVARWQRALYQWRGRHLVRAITDGMSGCLAAPIACVRSSMERGLGVYAYEQLDDPAWQRKQAPGTRAYLWYQMIHPDRMIGPRCLMSIEVRPADTELHMRAQLASIRRLRSMEVEVYVDGVVRVRQRIETPECTLVVPLGGISPGRHEMEIRCSRFVIPDQYLCNRDMRPLAMRLKEISHVSGSERLSGGQRAA